MRKLLPVLVAGLLALTACATPETPNSGTDQLARDREAATTAGKVDLNFAVSTLDGGTFDGTSLAGKPAVLWFWAPWCPTCAAEAPDISRAAATYGGKVTIVGVAGLDDVAAMRRFVEQTKVDNIQHLADEKGVVWKRFGVTEQSTFVLLNDSGQVIYHGHLDSAGLDRRIAELAR